MELSSELVSKGWHLSNDGLEICKEGVQHPTITSIIHKALDLDLREIGKGFFPDDVGRGKLDFISGSGVAQIQKIKNASAPKYEYGSGAPPILKLLLTDGNSFVNCLQWGPWKSITMDTPPGTKIYLKPGKIAMQNNFMLLSENQFTLLGGCVAPMVEKWELCRRLASHVRTKGDLDGNGPPPWIPFGKPIAAKPTKGKNFRALETENKEIKEEDEAFKQQRLANIAEVARVKEGKPKVFGGGKDIKQANSKTDSNNFSHFQSNNSYDSQNYSKPHKNVNEYENYQSPRKQDEERYPKNNRNNKNWSNHDLQRTQTSAENANYGNSYTKDRRPDQRNKFNSNEFQNARNQVTNQQKVFGNNSYRGNEGANFSKKPNSSKPSNFYENPRNSVDKHYNSSKSSDIEDLSDRVSQVKFHGYDTRNDSSVSIPSKPFLKKGTEVMAKYWEDNKYYRAIVHAVGKEGTTCVVLFLDYKNYEEVLVDDVQPVQSSWNAGPLAFHPSHWDNRNKNQDFRTSSEFHDNSNKSPAPPRGRYDRQKAQRNDFRPSAKLYQPPQQRQPS